MVITYKGNLEKIKFIRNWLNLIREQYEINHIFVYGDPEQEKEYSIDKDGVVCLNTDDRKHFYNVKVRKAFEFVIKETGYTRIMKLDDDTYIRPEYLARLMDITHHDPIVGFLNDKPTENVIKGKIAGRWQGAFYESYMYILDRNVMEYYLDKSETSDLRLNQFESKFLCDTVRDVCDIKEYGYLSLGGKCSIYYKKDNDSLMPDEYQKYLVITNLRDIKDYQRAVGLESGYKKKPVTGSDDEGNKYIFFEGYCMINGVLKVDFRLNTGILDLSGRIYTTNNYTDFTSYDDPDVVIQTEDHLFGSVEYDISGNTIVNTFFDGNILPDTLVECMESFMLEGHRLMVWSYNKIENLPSMVENSDASKIISMNLLYQFPSRLRLHAFKWFLIEKIDGWWVDPDVYCNRYLDLPDETVFATEYVTIAGKQVKRATSSVMKLGKNIRKRVDQYVNRHTNPKTVSIDDLDYKPIESMMVDEILLKHMKDVIFFSPMTREDMELDEIEFEKRSQKYINSYTMKMYNR